MDNNLVENAIRPFVIGRKNFLFCHTVNGANASATLYSLIETAKANGIEPYAYRRTVFTDSFMKTLATLQTYCSTVARNLAIDSSHWSEIRVR